MDAGREKERWVVKVLRETEVEIGNFAETIGMPSTTSHMFLVNPMLCLSKTTTHMEKWSSIIIVQQENDILKKFYNEVMILCKNLM